jgi:hypothetical protein
MTTQGADLSVSQPGISRIGMPAVPKTSEGYFWC